MKVYKVQFVSHFIKPRVISSAGRASPLQGEGHWFEPSITHQFGPVAQLVRAPACHVGGREFKSLQDRHTSSLA